MLQFLDTTVFKYYIMYNNCKLWYLKTTVFQNCIPKQTLHLFMAKNTIVFKTTLRASLETPISHGILIFPRENELISLGKMRIPWEIGVSKLALNPQFSKILRIVWPCALSRTTYTSQATLWLLKVCLVGLWKKLMWAVSCEKSCCKLLKSKNRLVETTKNH